MSEASLAVQTAIYARLKNDSILSGMVKGVFDNVPNTFDEFPYVTLGDTTENEWDTDETNGFQVTIPISVWSRYKGKRQASLVQQRIYELLHKYDQLVNDIKFYSVLCRSDGQNVTLDPDGLTRHGIADFRILVRGK